MKSKNIKTIAAYALRESFFPYRPSKQVANMPKNYLMRIILFIWTYVFLGAIFIGVFKASAMIYVRSGQNYMYFVNFAMAITMMIFIFYVPDILSKYFTKADISNYQTLPLSQGELFLGKVIGGISSFFDFFLFFAIGLYIYFGEAGFDPMTLILGLITLLPMIAIPYGLICLMILLIKKFTNVNRHAKLFKTLGYLLMFGIMGVIYYFSFSSSSKTSPSFNIDVDNITSMLGNVSNVFFNAKIFGLALSGPIIQRLGFSLLLLALAALVLFLVYKLGDKYYFDAVFDDHIDMDKKKKAKAKDIEIKTSSQFKDIFLKDIKTLFSNIVFVAGPISMLIIFSIMGFTTGRNLIEDVDPTLFQSSMTSLICFAAAFALSLLIWTNGNPATTSLSREGKSFYLIQTLPIDPKSHMLARFTSSYVVISIFNLILATAYGLILSLGLINSLLFFLGLSLGGAFATMISLYFGTFVVNTNWKKPQEVQQANPVKSIIFYLGSLLVTGLLVGGFFLIEGLTGSMVIAVGLIILVLAIIVGLIYMACLKKYKKGFMDV
ncbi:hypothetical protein [uncultured Anaerococcus sp.]|uniref:hypothetical protein n=1 Tax=uncultured Anaerococcus sp. TaxID=293428 RepID=UPI00262DAAEC|nr:hypothetical protein [uncultured Anaerococcus sp.]